MPVPPKFNTYTHRLGFLYSNVAWRTKNKTTNKKNDKLGLLAPRPNDTKIDDLEWPFCVKICFGFGNYRLSDKTVRKLAELPIYCQRQKCSPGNVVSGSIRFMQIFAGVCWRGGVKWEWRFSVHSVTVFRTFYTHGYSTAFTFIRLSMTLGIFQGHWTVSHQISQKRCVIRQKLL